MADLLTLESDALRVVVAPYYGARLVNLVDRRAGREWLTQGGFSNATGEDAPYGSAEAVGWDECFPTVSPCDARHTAWGRWLRNHGDVWGRPWAVLSSSAVTATMLYEADLFTFERTLTVQGAALEAAYSVTNRSGEPLPYLWALHALLSVSPGDRIELAPASVVTPTFLSNDDDAGPKTPMMWDSSGGAIPFPLTEVQSRQSGFAGKFLAAGLQRRARVGRSGSWLSFDWDAANPALGIWLTYGGWPTPGGHQEIAIEPTNAAADDLLQAVAAGAPPLAVGETRHWQVRLTVSA